METVVLPDNGFGGLPAGMNHWQIVNTTARSMAGGGEDWKRQGGREGGGEEGRQEEEEEEKSKPGNERRRIKGEIQLAPPVLRPRCGKAAAR